MPSLMNIGSVGFGGATGVDGSSGITGTSTTGGCGVGSGTNTGGSTCGFVSGSVTVFCCTGALCSELHPVAKHVTIATVSKLFIV
ncbi:hypothetical protein NVP1174O_46 [Vibrio phage 1.174.O._10N.261.55.A8]|nr:hypothetical protein NVP1174O_46 [Vibrio phage 1.174.O._10N.261.55.A8]